MQKSGGSEKRAHRSRYSLNTQYTFGNDESRLPKGGGELREALSQWDAISARRKERLLRGDVPHELVGELWLKLSGAGDLLDKNKGVFETLLAKGRCPPGEEEKIVKDIARTFPDVVANVELQTALFNVLKSYNVFDPNLGYCQGLNFLGATLLHHLSAEESFWMLVSLLKGRYDLRALFSAGVPDLVSNLYCLDRFIELYLPHLFSHFKEQRISPILFASEWFTTLFGYNFELEFTTAIWTVALSVGKLYLFRVAMSILRLQEKELLKMEFENIILRLKHPGVSAKDVIEEADRFASIDDKLYMRIRREAAAHTVAENLV